MRRLRRLWGILKATSAHKILIGFLVYTLGASLVLALVEPGMRSYGDALWYSFSVITTIGFGDYAAVTVIGRVVSVLLGVYGLLVVALIPGVLVSYYLDFVKDRVEDSAGELLEKLERLDELSKDELREISRRIKSKRY